jgi:two-component system LytT family response regulator
MNGAKNVGSLIRCMVIDSDPSTCKSLVNLLSTHPAMQIVKGCTNGWEAIGQINEFRPDVLLCEVEVPRIDGFRILETLSPKKRPSTIFTSHSDRYAAQAFDFAAADYLIKPFGQDRLWKAIDRAKNQMESMQTPDSSTGRSGRQLVIRSGRSVIFVRSDEVDWAEAEGKYVRLHMGKEFLVVKIGISALEAELDPDQFVRIHRSTLVNVDRVRLVQPWNNRRTYQVTLQDGTQLVLSRKSKLLEMSRSISSLNQASYKSDAFAGII